MLQPKTEQDKAKIAAGRKAIATYFRNDMQVGLGSGTTSHLMVRALGEEVKKGLRIAGVPTSNATRAVAIEVGVPLLDLNDVTELEVTLDGPDEVDHQGRMIKGGGACLLWEKMVARASKRMVCIADDSKIVDTLGRFPLPIEVIQFGWRNTAYQLQKLFTEFGFAEVPIIRRGGDNPVITDSGNYILDCHLKAIGNPDGLAPRFNEIPGVVEHGLFVGIANEIVIGHADGTADVVVY